MSNELARRHCGEMSPMERKFLSLAMSFTQYDDVLFPLVVLPVRKVLNVVAGGHNSRSYDRLQAIVERFASMPLEFVDQHNERSAAGKWFEECAIDGSDEGLSLRFSMADSLIKHCLFQRSNYISFALDDALAFERNGAAARLWQFFKSCESLGQCKVRIDVLLSLIGTDRESDCIGLKRVIMPAIRQINQLSDINVYPNRVGDELNCRIFPKKNTEEHATNEYNANAYEDLFPLNWTRRNTRSVTQTVNITKSLIMYADGNGERQVAQDKGVIVVVDGSRKQIAYRCPPDCTERLPDLIDKYTAGKKTNEWERFHYVA